VRKISIGCSLKRMMRGEQTAHLRQTPLQGEQRLRTLPTMSASQLLPAVAGPDDGTKAGSACSRRTSGPVGPKLGEHERRELLELLRDGQPWKNRRYSISSTRSSVLSTTPSTSVNFSKRSVSPTLSREQSVPLALRTPKRFSTNASATRSTDRSRQAAQQT